MKRFLVLLLITLQAAVLFFIISPSTVFILYHEPFYLGFLPIVYWWFFLTFISLSIERLKSAYYYLMIIPGILLYYLLSAELPYYFFPQSFIPPDMLLDALVPFLWFFPFLGCLILYFMKRQCVNRGLVTITPSTKEYTNPFMQWVMDPDTWEVFWHVVIRWLIVSSALGSFFIIIGLGFLGKYYGLVVEKVFLLLIVSPLAWPLIIMITVLLTRLKKMRWKIISLIAMATYLVMVLLLPPIETLLNG
ncbi:MAG: hypothetical protein ABIH34_02915 [Nanoarchaeota archaeon]